MLSITPKGYNYQGGKISIPFSSVSSCEQLVQIISNDYNLSNGKLVHKHDNNILPRFFDEPFLVDNDRIIDIDYINNDKCVCVEIELFDRSSYFLIYTQDILRRGIYSIPFVIPNRKYKFYVDEKEIDINKKFDDITEFVGKSNYFIKIVMVE